jgi:N-acetylmuramoyl-L-alanine amidase
MEYEFNRAIVKKIITWLNQLGIKYYKLVPESTDILLDERVARPNKRVTPLQKIYVSVHGNAASDDWSDANGIETFYYTGSAKSSRLAKAFQNRLITQVGWRDRGIKEANFYVIKYTQMPAILTENGFFSNQEECKKMLDDTWRTKIAEAHVKAIVDIEKIGLNF